MSGLVGSVKDILSVKFKTRHDAYTDQFSRVFLVKMMMVGVLFIGLNWYSDKVACIIPGTLGIDGGFVASACWINGFYVYEEIRYHANDLGYYGMPRDIEQNGRLEDGNLCTTVNKQSGKVTPGCKEMTKTFFLQYQYLVYFVAAMAALYYAPYILFKIVNTDMISLKGTVKKNEADPIIKNYFNHKINSPGKMRARIFLNLLVKVLYIISNVLAFVLTDSVLNGRFRRYGIQWSQWSKLDNEMAYDYMGMRLSPKPGNVLLPSFGFCEVHEAARDIKHQVMNKHKFVCEISQHILYQYVFIIFWFVMIVGIIVSVMGLLLQILDHATTISSSRKMYRVLTLRECEYLEFIRRKNLALYGEVIRKLKDDRFDGLSEPRPHGDQVELLGYNAPAKL